LVVQILIMATVTNSLLFNSCFFNGCPAGQICKLVQVQCVAAPCYPVPMCVNATFPICPGGCPIGQLCILQQILRALFPQISLPSCSCNKNEEFRQCSSKCEAKCGQWEPVPCIQVCDEPACQCSAGFYRNSVGQCVSREECG
ncbi:hypothetical protein PFISCL1PPCAC_1478, partial [Pristionchus fissidentatus]